MGTFVPFLLTPAPWQVLGTPGALLLGALWLCPTADMVPLCPGAYKRDRSSLNPKVAPLGVMAKTFSKPQKPAHCFIFVFIMQLIQVFLKTRGTEKYKEQCCLHPP